MKLTDISTPDLHSYYHQSVARFHLVTGSVVVGYVVQIEADQFYISTKPGETNAWDVQVHRNKIRDITLPDLGYFVWHGTVMYAVRTPFRGVGKGLSARNVQVDVAKGWALLASRKRTPCSVTQAAMACTQRSFPIEGPTYRILSEDTMEVISPSGKLFKYTKEIHVSIERGAAPGKARQSRRPSKAGNFF